MRRCHLVRGWLALLAATAASLAQAHSASDAYLTLDLDPKAAVVRGQWDIALRDLDFVLKLDDDGNGDITWGELRGHQAEIARYAMTHLDVQGDGRPCALAAVKQRVDDHADGAYAVVYFEARCAAVPQKVTLAYKLFFDIDPSHRAIVVVHNGDDTATALMAPDHARIDLKVGSATAHGPTATGR